MIFTAASLAAGLALISGMLIAAHGFQGLGAVAMLATNAAPAMPTITAGTAAPRSVSGAA
ncbi:MAG TPA: hypothetical protein VFO16_04310 [Pseudonocardiaceae bacterium]|nr:hypothetical protein [Pseudonocardiaceae bacterium]